MRKYAIPALLATAAFAVSGINGAYASSPYKGPFYLSVFGGLTEQDDTEFDYAAGATITTTNESGYAAGAALGYNVGQVGPISGIRTELEISYRKNDVEDHSLNGGAALAGPTGETEATAFMLNGYHDFLLGSSFVPYVGAGIGFANVKFKDFGVTAIPDVLDDDQNVFAYQAMAGVRYSLTQALALGIEYRYFATNDVDVTSQVGFGSQANYATHNGLVNLSYSF
jgi:opacity protein-like surface antigen